MDPIYQVLLATICGVVTGIALAWSVGSPVERRRKAKAHKQGYAAGQRNALESERMNRPRRTKRVIQDRENADHTRVTKARITKPRRRGSNHS